MDREAAWWAVHDALPDGWRVSRAEYHAEERRWHVWAVDTRSRGRRARHAAIEGIGATEVEALEDLTRWLERAGSSKEVGPGLTAWRKERYAEPSMLMVDAQTAKGGRAGPTFHDAGGRGGRVVGSKRTILVDILGLPFACRLDPARPYRSRPWHRPRPGSRWRSWATCRGCGSSLPEWQQVEMKSWRSDRAR